MISGVLNERLGILLTSDQERQARLPVAMGGLGIERAEDIASSAYLGNLLATRRLVSILLKDATLSLEGMRGAVAALHDWEGQSGVEVAHVDDLWNLKEMDTREGKTHPQRVLAGFVHRRLLTNLLANTHDLREGLRLRAVAREDAGAWWNVVPVKQLGLKFDRDEYLALVKWWLGVRMYVAVQEDGELVCLEGKCGEEMDAMQLHVNVDCET